VTAYASPAAYRLADAITAMAARYARSEVKAAYAFSRSLTHRDHPEKYAADVAEAERHTRAADRRYKALRRLTVALRDLDGAR
jgi:hypothetical protein